MARKEKLLFGNTCQRNCPDHPPFSNKETHSRTISRIGKLGAAIDGNQAIRRNIFAISHPELNLDG